MTTDDDRLVAEELASLIEMEEPGDAKSFTYSWPRLNPLTEERKRLARQLLQANGWRTVEFRLDQRGHTVVCLDR